MISFVSQPNARTCQSACIAMALGLETNEDVLDIRSALEDLGEPGNPYVMGEYLRSKIGDRYRFELSSSLSQMIGWLNDGEFLITHGWFTGSGHVIALNGVVPDQKTLGIRFKVSDPWTEFHFRSWTYPPNGEFGFQGEYSALGIYAAAIVGESVHDAQEVYNSRVLDLGRSGAWVHRIKAN